MKKRVNKEIYNVTITKDVESVKRPVVRLTKLTELSDASFPNNIPVGFVEEGGFIREPVVGESFWLSYFATSVVTEILSENTFKTRNSVYKWEVLK